MAEKQRLETLEKRIRELEQALQQRGDANCECESDGIGLSQILQGTSIPTFVINRDHLIVHYNPACERLTGLNAETLIGTRDQWKAFYAHPRPILADLLVDKAETDELDRLYGAKYRKSKVIEGAYEAEDFFPNLGEDGKWLFFTAAPIRSAAGDIIGAVETLQDITDQKRAEADLRESRRRYRTFLDFLPYPIVVSEMDGTVSYVNPAFTEIFGWTREEIRGRRNPFIPEDKIDEFDHNLALLKEKRILQRHISQRVTRDGTLRIMAITAAVYSEFQNQPAGVLEIMRDITREIQDERRGEAILRISQALPEYPDLEELLDFISGEIKRLTDSEGALVILLDEEKEELFFLGAAYDDTERQRRAKEIRFRLDELLAGEVIRTGEPMIVNDALQTADLYPERDRRFGYRTENFLLVPLKSGDRIIGILAALNIKTGRFDESHVELLGMLAGSVALSIENARYAEEIKKAYREVSSLNRAKGKAINHLSHELKTPVSIIGGSMSILADTLEALPEENWRSTLERTRRNLNRIVEIQDEVEDIMQGGRSDHGALTSRLFEACVDTIETLLAEEVGEGGVVAAVRRKIEDMFNPASNLIEKIDPGRFVQGRLAALKPQFAHRRLEINTEIEACPPIYMPSDALEKVIDGLIRNAVENTPDEGKIDIFVKPEGRSTRITIRDFGIGIIPETGRRIFEGFFSNRDILSYSSRRPFDFNAGGKGADLLRTKIFSERYHFKIDMTSERCGYIPAESDHCPGRIGDCEFCRSPEDCHRSGTTTFSLEFPSSGPPAGPNARAPKSI